MINAKKNGNVDISNLRTDYRKIIKENTATVRKVMLSFFGLYFLIGFTYDVIIKYLHINLNSNYNKSQGLREYCEKCSVTFVETISGFLTLEFFPIITISFMFVAMVAIIYARFSYVSVMFMGLPYYKMGMKGEKEVITEIRRRDDEDLDEGRGFSEKEKTLYNITEEMRIASLLKFRPDVYIFHDRNPNSFSLSSDRDGFIAVSDSAIETLTRDELSALVAHEFAHMKVEDNKVAYYVDTLSHTLDFLLDLMYELSYIMMRVGGVGGGSSDSKSDNKSSGAVIVVIALVVMALSFILRLLVPFVTLALRRFLKEGSDLRADAMAIKFTRNPIGLHNLLEKQFNYDYDDELKNSTRNHSSFFMSEKKSWFSKHFQKDKPTFMRRRLDNTIKDVERYNKEKQIEK